MVHYHKLVSTGALYEETVRAMSTYRSMAARMHNANTKTQAKLDNAMILLSERIGELLRQLTDTERSALSCWQNGTIPNTYCVDHDALRTKPYISIRRIERIYEAEDICDDTSDDITSNVLELDKEYWQRLRQIIKRTNG